MVLTILATGTAGAFRPQWTAFPLFRSRTSGRQILVVLDNATGEEQVRPLPAWAAAPLLDLPIEGAHEPVERLVEARA